MEHLKNCLPEIVSTYLSEHKVCDVVNAAVLVDEYVLTHKTVFVDRPFCYGNEPFVGLNGNGKDTVKSLAGVSQCGFWSLRG